MLRVGVDTSALSQLTDLFNPEEVKSNGGITSLGTVMKIALFDGLTNAMRLIVSRARANAPIDTGRLRASIGAFIGGTQVVPFGEIQGFTGARANYRNDAFESGIKPGRNIPPRAIPEVLTGQVVATADYAFLVHETMNPAGPVQPREFQNTPEGGTGGKFLSRAIEHNRDNILRVLQESISRSLQSFTTRGSQVIGKRPNTKAFEMAARLAGIGQVSGDFPGGA